MGRTLKWQLQDNDLPAGPRGHTQPWGAWRTPESGFRLREQVRSTQTQEGHLRAGADTRMARERAMALGRTALFAARRGVVPQVACLQSAKFATGKAAAKEPLKPSSPNHIIVTVNDKQVEVLKGATVMAACEAAGIDIPRHTPLFRCPECSLLCRMRRSAKEATGCAGSATTSACLSPETAACAWWRCARARATCLTLPLASPAVARHAVCSGGHAFHAWWKASTE